MKGTYRFYEILYCLEPSGDGDGKIPQLGNRGSKRVLKNI